MLPVETRVGVIDALLDTGAEVNVISRDLADQLNLPITPIRDIRAIGFTGEGDNFSGIIEELDIKIMDYIVIIHTFVIKVMDPKYKLILRGPYHKGSRVKIMRNGDGNYYVTLYD